MIKSNELRIGNYVNEAIAGPIKITLSILMHIEGSENYKPIPLTEYILLKCGFKKVAEKIGTRGVYGKYGLNLSLSNSGIFYRKINHPVLYLHQLQNLYFALTGKELKVNF